MIKQVSSVLGTWSLNHWTTREVPTCGFLTEQRVSTRNPHVVQLYCAYIGASQVVKNSPANVGDAESIPGLERSPGGGHDSPLQYSCLENPMDKGAWKAMIRWVRELEMTEMT